MKEKQIKKAYKHFLIFGALLLILFPILQIFFTEGISLDNKIKTVLFLQRVNVVAFVIGLIIIRLAVKHSSLKALQSIKMNFMYLILASLLFMAVFTTQGDLNKILNEGVSISIRDMTARTNFDSSRLFNIHLFNNIDSKAEFLELNNNHIVRKTIDLNQIPENPRLFFALTYFNDPLDFSSSNFYLSVNGNWIYLNKKLESLFPFNDNFVYADLPAKYLNKGENNIDFYFSDPFNQSIYLFSQRAYLQGKTFSSDILASAWESIASDEALVFIKEPNSFWFSLLFRLGYALKITGIILLFIACFGSEFSGYIWKKTKKLFRFKKRRK